jgi:hypothetical protein
LQREGFATGLPDVFFSNQKFQFGQILEGLRWENVDIFLAIWSILRTFGIFYDHWVLFVFIWYILSGFGIMYQEKSGNPGLQQQPHIRTVIVIAVIYPVADNAFFGLLA